MCALFRADLALGTDSVRTHPLPRSRLPATSFLKRFNVWYVLFSKGKGGGKWEGRGGGGNDVELDRVRQNQRLESSRVE